DIVQRPGQSLEPRPVAAVAVTRDRRPVGAWLDVLPDDEDPLVGDHVRVGLLRRRPAARVGRDPVVSRARRGTGWTVNGPDRVTEAATAKAEDRHEQHDDADVHATPALRWRFGAVGR